MRDVFAAVRLQDRLRTEQSMNGPEVPLLPGWSHRIRMVSSARLWKSFLLAFGIPAVLLGIVVALVSGPADGATVVVGSVVLFAVLWAIVGAVIDVGGGFTAAYLLTTEGIHFTMGRGAKGAANVAALVGVMARSPGGAGAGLLARSEQEAFLAWNDIRKVTISEGGRYIQVRAGFGSKPIAIHCTEANFLSVRDHIRARATTAGA